MDKVLRVRDEQWSKALLSALNPEQVARVLGAFNSIHRNDEAAAPQAQEETRGAPGPADIRAGLADTFRGVLREYDAKSLDENEAIEEIFGAIRDFRQPQPPGPDRLITVYDVMEVQGTLPKAPAPASPVGRECWVEWHRGKITGSVMSEDPGPDFAQGGAEWVRMVEAPAAPEAGVPGTQRPSTIEAAAMLAEAIRRAGTQEGGSQP